MLKVVKLLIFNYIICLVIFDIGNDPVVFSSIKHFTPELIDFFSLKMEHRNHYQKNLLIKNFQLMHKRGHSMKIGIGKN